MLHIRKLTPTDPTGPYAIPHVLDGIPLQIKHVSVSIDRQGFTFNPTNCSPLALTGTIGSDEGASAAASVPFQITNCAALKFAPKFSVSTNGNTSKAKGASLSVKLTYPNAPLGTYANLAKAKVSLPKQLPSRLTTLQKACLAEVFDANPANCPANSIVGHAKVITPILPVPLEGPAYFVSHGGEAFPDLTIVLKGYGVTVHLIGSTQIKNGITTSTFKATPDVPFSSFELTLPQGPDSALAANTTLCGAKLAMPTEFTAQNGAVLTQSTPIAITGCKKPLTNQQKLTKALKTCHKKKNKGNKRKSRRTVKALRRLHATRMTSFSSSFFHQFLAFFVFRAVEDKFAFLGFLPGLYVFSSVDFSFERLRGPFFAGPDFLFTFRLFDVERERFAFCGGRD
jgi:hypothetical protein